MTRSTRRTRLFARCLGTALASTLVVASVLITVPSSAKVPRLPHRYPAAIEKLADYTPQRKCSPSAKKGTVAFANMLLRTYKFSRSLGIVRACGVGGTSEHKEGRAFDWGVSAFKKRDRRGVNALMHWLLKKDRHGNRYANARRLGIQYMIWNRRIWGAYSASSGWRRYSGASPHTDHVHFSLSWQGARKMTSFWRPRRFSDRPRPPKPNNPKPNSPKPGNPKPSDPEPRNPKPSGNLLPEPRGPRGLADGPRLRSERVFVPAKRRFGARTKGSLEAGRYYLIEASGTFRYGAHSRSVADAECSTGPRSSWQRDRSLVERQRDADHLDLYVDGHDLYANAESGDDCDRGSHTYRWVYQAQRDGRVPLRIWDPRGHNNNKGALRVRVTDMSVRDRMEWDVPADQAVGVTSPGSLQAGTEYQVTVRGVWSAGGGYRADAECSVASGDRTWRRDRSAVASDPDADHFDVLQDRGDLGLEPVVHTGDNCNAQDHAYRYRFTPSETRPVNFRVDDPRRYADNQGKLTVSIKPYVEPAPEPAPAPEPQPEPQPEPEPEPIQAETVTVQASNPSAVQTQQSYPAGTELRLTVTGSYRAHERVQADAECASWRREDLSWSEWGNHFGGDYDVTVDGVASTWWPHDGGTCDADHTYSRDITVERDGPVRLKVADPWSYSDNSGSLTVTVEPR